MKRRLIRNKWLSKYGYTILGAVVVVEVLLALYYIFYL